MTKKQRTNIFEKNRVKDNFFIELPIDTVDKQHIDSTWTEKLLELSTDKETLKACREGSSKQFFAQLFKNGVLEQSSIKSNAKVVMGETWAYTNFTIIAEGGGIVLTLVLAVAEVAALVVKTDDLEENALRSEKHRSICKFAIKNGGESFGREIIQIFQKLEAGETVTL